MTHQFKVGDEVFLPEYVHLKGESRDWALEAKIPLNTPLVVKYVSEHNSIRLVGYDFIHMGEKFRLISELSNKEINIGYDIY